MPEAMYHTPALIRCFPSIVASGAVMLCCTIRCCAGVCMCCRCPDFAVLCTAASVYACVAGTLTVLQWHLPVLVIQ